MVIVVLDVAEFNRQAPGRRRVALAGGGRLGHSRVMFTIEHEFDATVVTLVDEGGAHLQEDVTITAFEDCVVLEQLDRDGETVRKITLSLSQLADLREALNLPEGVYKRKDT